MYTVEIGHKITGTNAERLAISAASLGRQEITFYETDTNAEYEWKGSEWIQTKSNGSILSRQTANDVAVPESYFLNDGVTAKTAAALFTTADISSYSHAVVHISGLTGETIAITGLIDGTIETAAIKSTTTAGVDAAAATLGNGTFYLTDLAVKNLKFTKSAAVEAATVTIALKV